MGLMKMRLRALLACSFLILPRAAIRAEELTGLGAVRFLARESFATGSFWQPVGWRGAAGQSVTVVPAGYLDQERGESTACSAVTDRGGASEFALVPGPYLIRFDGHEFYVRIENYQTLEVGWIPGRRRYSIRTGAFYRPYRSAASSFRWMAVDSQLSPGPLSVDHAELLGDDGPLWSGGEAIVLTGQGDTIAPPEKNFELCATVTNRSHKAIREFQYQARLAGEDNRLTAPITWHGTLEQGQSVNLRSSLLFSVTFPSLARLDLLSIQYVDGSIWKASN
jgi:hypothetical protein